MSKKKILNYKAQLEGAMSQLEQTQARLNRLLGKTTSTVGDFSGFVSDLDLQQFCSRYKWEGLPKYMPDNIIERLLYFKGNICLFFNGGTLYALPYSFNGRLDPYTYPTAIRPIALNGNNFGNKDLITYPNGTINKKAECVILSDRIPTSFNDTVTPRASIQQDIINLMNDALISGNINLKNSLKKGLVGVDSEDQVAVMEKDIEEATKSNSPYIVTAKGGMSTKAMEVWNNNIPVDMESYIQYLSALNNLRCYSLGIKNQGIYEKTERMLVGQLSGVAYQTNLILETGLQCRINALERLKELYPEYKSILDKIKVSINIDPYVDLSQRVNEEVKEHTENVYKEHKEETK